MWNASGIQHVFSVSANFIMPKKQYSKTEESLIALLKDEGKFIYECIKYKIICIGKPRPDGKKESR